MTAWPSPSADSDVCAAGSVGAGVLPPADALSPPQAARDRDIASASSKAVIFFIFMILLLTVIVKKL